MQKLMVKTNKVKDKEQRTALNSWAKTGFIGSIIAGTGFGKSRCGIMAIDHILKHKDNAKAIVLVPTIQLQEQFSEEFHKWGKDNCLNRVEILCYQSAYKLQNQHYDIVVCDEIHLGLSPEYRKFFKNNTYDKLLCMTATIPEEYEYRVILNGLAPIAYQLTLDECVKLKIVAPYKISCVPIKLTFSEQIDYKKINKNFVYWKFQLGQFDAFNEAKRILGDHRSSSEDRQAAVQFYRCIRERKIIVDFALNKVKKFQKLILKNSDKKILVFSGANKFTDALCDSVSPLALSYHSNKTKKQREDALQKFRDGDINILCSTKALNQGLDIPDANMGIICGLTSKSLSMIQRVGRLLRFKKGKTGEIIILYVKNSQEEKWLNNAVRTLDNVRWV
jgi:superfamily II DNA or RNA helicase